MAKKHNNNGNNGGQQKKGVPAGVARQPRKGGNGAAALPDPNFLWLASIAAVLGLSVLSQHAVQLTGVAERGVAENKPYATFEEFYPFYLTQHEDDVCRKLHVAGTSIIAVLALLNPVLVPAITLAGSFAYIAFHLTRFLPHGIVEAVVLMGTFIVLARRFTGSTKLALGLPLVGYSFAWVGHFFFELNKPATFVYPLFSLMGDLRMWADFWSSDVIPQFAALLGM